MICPVSNSFLFLVFAFFFLFLFPLPCSHLFSLFFSVSSFPSFPSLSFYVDNNPNDDSHSNALSLFTFAFHQLQLQHLHVISPEHSLLPFPLRFSFCKASFPSLRLVNLSRQHHDYTHLFILFCSYRPPLL